MSDLSVPAEELACVHTRWEDVRQRRPQRAICCPDCGNAMPGVHHAAVELISHMQSKHGIR